LEELNHRKNKISVKLCQFLKDWRRIMSKKLTKFDVADYLDNESVIAEYLTAILETGDTSLLISSIGDIAKAKGMGQIAVKSGLGRESLYKALKSDSQPRFETILKVLDSLDIKIKFEEKYVT